MLAIAGRTAEPNWLLFFDECLGVKIGKKINVNVFLQN